MVLVYKLATAFTYGDVPGHNNKHADKLSTTKKNYTELDTVDTNSLQKLSQNLLLFVMGQKGQITHKIKLEYVTFSANKSTTMIQPS